MKIKSKAAEQKYFRYLQLVRTLREKNKLPTLDPIEESVINALGITWQSGEEITVVQLLKRKELASPTSIHRRIKTLTKKKLLQLRLDEDDHRFKYVCPGEMAKKYFSSLTDCIVKAVRV